MQYFFLAHADLLHQLGISALVFLCFFILSKLSQHQAIPLLQTLFKKLKTNFFNDLLDSLNRPLANLLLVVGAQVALGRLFPLGIPLLLNQCFRTGYVLLAAWIFCNLVDLVPLFPQRDWSNAESVKKILRRILKVLILSFAVVIALGEFGYNVNGLIAGLGLGGLTLSLAAKDSAANLFSGFLLLVERPFEVGDWITCTAAEGTVEDISFRSTTIRTFANTVSLVPNSVLCASPITNVTRMKMRLVKLTLGVCYGTPRAKLESLIAALRGRLAADADIVPDTAEVRLSGFEESHLSILVLFYTKTTAYREWLAVTERLNFEILECMEQSGVDFAFPTRTVYLGDTTT